MIVVVEIIKAVPGKAKELRQALIEIVPISRKTPGCLQYDLFDPAGEREEFLVLMRWKKLSDLRNHETSAYIQEFVEKYDKILYEDAIVTEWKEVTVS